MVIILLSALHCIVNENNREEKRPAPQDFPGTLILLAHSAYIRNVCLGRKPDSGSNLIFVLALRRRKLKVWGAFDSGENSDEDEKRNASCPAYQTRYGAQGFRLPPPMDGPTVLHC